MNFDAVLQLLVVALLFLLVRWGFVKIASSMSPSPTIITICDVVLVVVFALYAFEQFGGLLR